MYKPMAVRFSSGLPNWKYGERDTLVIRKRVWAEQQASGSNDEAVSTGKMSGRNLRPLRDWFEVQRLRTRPRPTRPKARRRSVEGSGVDVTVTLTKPQHERRSQKTIAQKVNASIIDGHSEIVPVRKGRNRRVSQEIERC